MNKSYNLKLMTSRFCMAVAFCVLSVATLSAQGLVRDDFDNAAGGDSVFTGWEGNIGGAAVIDLGVDPVNDRTFDRFRFSGGMTLGGKNNLGDITLTDFILAKVTSEAFTIEEFRTNYLNGTPYNYVDQVLTFDTPSNKDYSTPYNTDNALHLYELDFTELRFNWRAGEQARILFLGIDEPNAQTAGEFNISFSTSTKNLDYFDFSGDSVGLQSNIEFGFPYHTFAVDAYLSFATLLAM